MLLAALYILVFFFRFWNQHLFLGHNRMVVEKVDHSWFILDKKSSFNHFYEGLNPRTVNEAGGSSLEYFISVKAFWEARSLLTSSTTLSDQGNHCRQPLYTPQCSERNYHIRAGVIFSVCPPVASLMTVTRSQTLNHGRVASCPQPCYGSEEWNI